MGILETFSTACAGVFGSKIRSTLTMLGIIIGIGSVIMVTSIGAGVEAATTEEFLNLGLDALVITVKSGAEVKAKDYLTRDDEQTLKLSNEVTYAAPYYTAASSTKLQDPRDEKKMNVTGTTFEYAYAQPVEIYYGRFLSDLDDINRSAVAVIDASLAKSIFGTENAVGKQATFSFKNGSKTVDIIGICKPLSYGPFYEAPPVVYMPIATLMDYYADTVVTGYYVAIKDKKTMDAGMNEMSRLLEMSHDNTDVYNLQNLAYKTDVVINITRVVTTFIAFVAAVSLMVGGIGVMNIMLVTVSERTKEIGIRKSLGATDINIQIQFLAEALILTFIGGGLGLFLGYFGAIFAGDMVDIPPVISFNAVVLTVSVSSAVGIIFGVYPARKAAKMDPIEALRYE